MVRADPGLTIPGTFHDLGATRSGTPPASPRSRRRGLVRAARDRSRPWPLPGRGDSGGIPGGRVRPYRRPSATQAPPEFTWPAANIPAAPA